MAWSDAARKAAAEARKRKIRERKASPSYLKPRGPGFGSRLSPSYLKATRRKKRTRVLTGVDAARANAAANRVKKSVQENMDHWRKLKEG